MAKTAQHSPAARDTLRARCLRRAPDPCQSARVMMVGVAAFSSSFLGLEFVAAKWCCPVPPTSTPKGHNASCWVAYELIVRVRRTSEQELWIRLSYTNFMANTQYLALLRGINVGGGNIIKMKDLKACFEASKLENVATYIQSGNVLFETAETDSVKLVGKLEKALSKTFRPYKARIVLCSDAKLRQIVRKAPKGFGSQPQAYRYDVIFLKEPLTASAAMKSVTLKPGVDEAFVGPDVLYFSRLSARASQSHLPRIMALPIYQAMTIRNWNTTSKLLALIDARTQELT